MTEPKPNLDISSLPVYVPAMTVEKYANASGLSTETVLAWIKRGYISSVKIGKRRLINIAAMNKELTT